MNSYSNIDMATPINSLQNNNINNLVKNVENNIENLANTPDVQPSQQPQLNYNPYIPIPQNNTQNNIIEQEPEPEPVVEKTVWYKSIVSKSKEHLIVILLFSLIAHKKINKIVSTFVPIIKNQESPIPSLLFRGTIFAILLFGIRRLI